jgi:hypothetical protein
MSNDPCTQTHHISFSMTIPQYDAVPQYDVWTKNSQLHLRGTCLCPLYVCRWFSVQQYTLLSSSCITDYDFDKHFRDMIHDFLWPTVRTSRNTMPSIFCVLCIFLGEYRVLSFSFRFVWALCVFFGSVQGFVKSL